MPPKKATRPIEQTAVLFPLPSDGRLVPVPPGPDALLTAQAGVAIHEWIDGWLADKRLTAAGIGPPGPLLLHGPPGTGKTSVTRMLARRFADTRHVVMVDAMRVTESFLGAVSTWSRCPYQPWISNAS